MKALISYCGRKVRQVRDFNSEPWRISRIEVAFDIMRHSTLEAEADSESAEELRVLSHTNSTLPRCPVVGQFEVFYLEAPPSCRD
jgi:hypothetical protein